MAIKKFILQGFTPLTHAKEINSLLEIPNIQEVIISVSFINEGGVNLIEDKLRTVSSKTKVFSGIRNEITSYQGLAKLLKLGVKTFLVDTGYRNRIFHSKLYFARGKRRGRMIIGSSNLTPGGLNDNIEASIVLDLNFDEQKDKDLIKKIEAQFKTLPKIHPKNILLLEKISQLDSLLEKGLLRDEEESYSPSISGVHKDNIKDEVPRIKLQVPFLPRIVRSVKKNKLLPSRDLRSRKQKIFVPPLSNNLERVWVGKLKERDLNIPRGKRTHRTGSINLDKGNLSREIDQRNYFREVIFSNLKWVPSPRFKTVEETEAQFQLIIKGIYYGESILRIRHTISKDTPTYRQNNAMTRISWGSMRKYVAQRDYIGRTLSLYRDETNPTRFVLEID